MAINTTSNTQTFTGNGSTDTLSFGATFSITAATHLVVTKWATATPATITELVYNTDYTVNAALTSITLSAGVLASGYKVKVTRATPQLQGTDLTDYRATPLTTIENMVDNTVRMLQDVQGAADRSIQLSNSSSLTLPVTINGDPSNGQVPAWDSANEYLEWVTPGSPDEITGNTTTVGTKFNLFEGTNSGSNYVTVKAPDTIASTYTLTLPADDGNANELLSTNGSGDLSWVALNNTSSSASGSFTGTLTVSGNSSDSASLILKEDTDNGTDAVTIKCPSTLAASYTLTLPADDGTSNQVLTTDGSGGLSWTSPTSFPAQITASTTTVGTQFTFSEGTDNGTNYVILKAADTLAGNTTYTLPSADGSSGQLLSTNASGTLSWSYPSEITRATSPDQTKLNLFEASTNGSNKVVIQAPSSLAGDYTLTLPADDGTASQVLTTNGSGTLSWTTPSSSSVAEIVSASASGGTQFIFSEDTDNGTNAATLQCADSMSGNYTLKLPSALLSGAGSLIVPSSGNSYIDLVGAQRDFFPFDKEWTLLTSGTVSAASSHIIDLSTSYSSYSMFRLIMKNYLPSTTGAPLIRVSSDKGVTAITGASYTRAYLQMSASAASVGNNTTQTSYLPGFNTAANTSHRAVIDNILFGFNLATYRPLFWSSVVQIPELTGASTLLCHKTVGGYPVSATYDGLNIIPSTGTFSYDWVLLGAV